LVDLLVTYMEMREPNSAPAFDCSAGSRTGGNTRYDRCVHTFMSAICIAATIISWL
jgi:hypothetical protein